MSRASITALVFTFACACACVRGVEGSLSARAPCNTTQDCVAGIPGGLDAECVRVGACSLDTGCSYSMLANGTACTPSDARDRACVPSPLTCDGEGHCFGAGERCSGRGVCVFSPGATWGYACVCDAGYAGQQCEAHVSRDGVAYALSPAPVPADAGGLRGGFPACPSGPGGSGVVADSPVCRAYVGVNAGADAPGVIWVPATVGVELPANASTGSGLVLNMRAEIVNDTDIAPFVELAPVTEFYTRAGDGPYTNNDNTSHPSELPGAYVVPLRVRVRAAVPANATVTCGGEPVPGELNGCSDALVPLLGRDNAVHVRLTVAARCIDAGDNVCTSTGPAHKSFVFQVVPYAGVLVPLASAAADLRRVLVPVQRALAPSGSTPGLATVGFTAYDGGTYVADAAGTDTLEPTYRAAVWGPWTSPRDTVAELAGRAVNASGVFRFCSSTPGAGLTVPGPLAELASDAAHYGPTPGRQNCTQHTAAVPAAREGKRVLVTHPLSYALLAGMGGTVYVRGHAGSAEAPCGDAAPAAGARNVHVLCNDTAFEWHHTVLPEHAEDTVLTATLNVTVVENGTDVAVPVPVSQTVSSASRVAYLYSVPVLDMSSVADNTSAVAAVLAAYRDVRVNASFSGNASAGWVLRLELVVVVLELFTPGGLVATRDGPTADVYVIDRAATVPVVERRAYTLHTFEYDGTTVTNTSAPYTFATATLYVGFPVCAGNTSLAGGDTYAEPAVYVPIALRIDAGSARDPLLLGQDDEADLTVVRLWVAPWGSELVVHNVSAHTHSGDAGTGAAGSLLVRGYVVANASTVFPEHSAAVATLSHNVTAALGPTVHASIVAHSGTAAPLVCGDARFNSDDIVVAPVTVSFGDDGDGAPVVAAAPWLSGGLVNATGWAGAGTLHGYAVASPRGHTLKFDPGTRISSNGTGVARSFMFDAHATPTGSTENNSVQCTEDTETGACTEYALTAAGALQARVDGVRSKTLAVFRVSGGSGPTLASWAEPWFTSALDDGASASNVYYVLTEAGVYVNPDRAPLETQTWTVVASVYSAARRGTARALVASDVGLVLGGYSVAGAHVDEPEPELPGGNGSDGGTSSGGDGDGDDGSDADAKPPVTAAKEETEAPAKYGAYVVGGIIGAAGVGVAGLGIASLAADASKAAAGKTAAHAAKRTVQDTHPSKPRGSRGPGRPRAQKYQRL